jgi:hypothetical protein
MFQGTTTELWSIMCPIVEIIVYNQANPIFFSRKSGSEPLLPPLKDVQSCEMYQHYKFP